MRANGLAADVVTVDCDGPGCRVTTTADELAHMDTLWHVSTSYDGDGRPVVTVLCPRCRGGARKA
jgi:hypothetical protein